MGGNGEHFFRVATEYLSEGRTLEATGALKAAIESDPTNLGYRFELLKLYQTLNHHEECILVLHELLGIEPSVVDEESHLVLTEQLLALGHRSKALERCTYYVGVRPSDQKGLEKLVECLKLEGDLRSAVIAYDSFLRRNDFAQIVTNSQHVSHTIVGKREYLQQQIRLLPNELRNCECTANHAEETYRDFQDGIDAARLGEWGKALQWFEKARTATPQCFYAFYNCAVLEKAIGKICGDVERLKNSLAMFHNYIAHDNTYGPSYRHLGGLLHLIDGANDKSVQEALECFKKALQLDPLDRDSCKEIIPILQLSGRFSESLPYLKTLNTSIERGRQESSFSSLKLSFLNSENTYAMGHLAFLPECYIKMQLLGWSEPRQAVLLAPKGHVANQSLLQYWKKYFTVITDSKEIDQLSPLAKDLTEETSYLKLPNGTVLNAHIARSYIQKEWEEQNRPPLLTLSDEHYQRGWEVLEQLGVPRGSWFVAVHARDGGFKKEGECLASAHRNVKIESFFSAFNLIAQRGGWVVRLGEPTSPKIPTMDKVIDYAHSEFKSDWMDVFLAAACKFYLSGGGGGLFCTAMLFGVPYVGTNLPLTPLREGKNELFMPKLLWNIKENRHVTFAEMFQAPLYQCESGFHVHQWGYRPIDNAEDEIQEAVREALDKAEGRILYTSEDDAMQAQYRELLPADTGVFTSRMGRYFLKKYANLLGC